MAKYDREEYYTVDHLLERGWTERAIRQLLPPPERLVPQPRGWIGPPRPSYSIDTVLQVERTAAWRAVRDQSAQERAQRYEQAQTPGKRKAEP